MSRFPLLTEADAARWAAIQPGQLAWLRRKGGGPRYTTLPTGDVRYTLEAMQEWAETGQVIRTTSPNVIPFPGSGVRVRTVLREKPQRRRARLRGDRETWR